MRKDIAQIWCQALRSGEFVQTKGYLDKRNAQCPLGVLTNLAMISGICDYNQVKAYGAFDNELGRLPLSVKEWADMYGQNGEIKGEFVNLTALNDLFDYTFTEIADIIEDNYENI